MKKLLKIICTTLIILIALIIISAILLVKFVDPNNFKDKITQEVFQHTGRVLLINGNIAWEFSPWPSLTVNDVLLSNQKILPPQNTDQTNSLIYKNLNLILMKSALTFSHIQINNLKINWGEKSNKNITLKSISFKIMNFDNPIIPININLYDGSLNGKIYINSTNQVQTITAKFKATNIKAALLLKDFFDFDKINGTANLDAELTFQNKKINGNGKFEISNGFWNSIDLAYQINLANSLINKKPKPEESNPPKTEFGNLTGTFTIENGVFKNNDLKINSSRFTATGNGSVNLENQNIDYLLDAKSSDGFSVPLKISGDLSSLKIALNTKNIGATIADALSSVSKRIKINGETGDKIIKALHIEKLFKK